MRKDVFGTITGLGMLAGVYVLGKKQGRKDAFNKVKTIMLESIIDAKKKEEKETKES